MDRPLVPYSDSDEDWEEEEDQSESEDAKIKHQEKKEPDGSEIKSEEKKPKMKSTKPANSKEPVDQKEKARKQVRKERKRTWDDIMDLYHMELRSERQSRRNRLKSRVYAVHFDTFEEPFEWAHEIFQAKMNQIKQDCGAKPKDKMRVSFLHPALDHGIFIPFDDCINMTGETVFNEFERVTQSNDRFNLHDGHMQADITLIPIPSGSGRTNMHHGAQKCVNHMTCSKKSIIQIQNDKDNSCFARAVVVGIAHANTNDTKDSIRHWNYIRKSDRPLQTKKRMNF